MRDTRVHDTLMAVAGGYLIYLGIRIIREGILGGGMEGRSRILGLIAAIAFVIIGAGTLIWNVQKLFASRKNAREETLLERSETETQDRTDEETAPAVDGEAGEAAEEPDGFSRESDTADETEEPPSEV